MITYFNVELLAIKHYWGQLRMQDEEICLSRNNIGPGISRDPCFLEGVPGGLFWLQTHPCSNTFKGLILLSRLRARKKTNKPTHSFSKCSQGAF